MNGLEMHVRGFRRNKKSSGSFASFSASVESKQGVSAKDSFGNAPCPHFRNRHSQGFYGSEGKEGQCCGPPLQSEGRGEEGDTLLELLLAKNKERFLVL